MKYSCCFPGCAYSTDERRLIEFHHVNPRELHPAMNAGVVVPLCPNHHKMIWHPDAVSGQHSVKHPGSMVILGVDYSSGGMCVRFADMSGNESITYPDGIYRPSGNALCASWSLAGGLNTDRQYIFTDADIADAVDSKGMYCSGMLAVYDEQHRRAALDYLLCSISDYMTRAKVEYDAALGRARDDWKTLRKLCG